MGWINFTLNGNRALVKAVVELMIMRIFFNTDTGTDKEKDNECFGTDIKYARKNNKGNMISRENVEFKKALEKGDIKRYKGE